MKQFCQCANLIQLVLMVRFIQITEMVLSILNNLVRANIDDRAMEPILRSISLSPNELRVDSENVHGHACHELTADH